MSKAPALPNVGSVALGTPLTPEQRSTLIAWIPRGWTWMAANGWSGGNHPDLNSLTDDELIQQYGVVVAAIQIHDTSGITLNPISAIQSAGVTNPLTGQQVSNPLTSVTQFLTMLSSKNLWIRVGEFTIGATLLAIAANAILKPGNVVSNFPTVKAIRKLG